MCSWVIAICNYQQVYKKVLPKKQKLLEVTAIKNAAEAELNQKLSQLAEVKEKVRLLEEECEQLNQQEKDLIAKIDRSQKQMFRAEKLVVLLADEGIRWKDSVESIQADIERLVGNVFISSACISYFGAYSGNYRRQLTDGWVKACISRKIPISQDFSLIKVMGDPVEIRGWAINGLPTD